MCVRERVQICVQRCRPAVLLLSLSRRHVRLLLRRRLVLVLALLNRQRQPGRSTRRSLDRCSSNSNIRNMGPAPTRLPGSDPGNPTLTILLKHTLMSHTWNSKTTS
jgi:hypothetical protein